MKTVLKRFFAVCLLFSIAFFIRYLNTPSNKVKSFSGQTMGTTYSYKLYADTDKEIVQREVEAILDEMNAQMSTYIENSLISEFNEFKSTEKFKIKKHFMKVLKTSFEVYEKSQKMFDPTMTPLINLWGFGERGEVDSIPESEVINRELENIGLDKIVIHNDQTISKLNKDVTLNFSAIAKGYAIDVIAKYFESVSEAYLIEIGGEVFAKGKHLDGAAWKVGIEKPDEKQRVISEVRELNNECVASSGDYRNFYKLQGKKYSHTISPLSGKPIENEVVGVSVIARNCILADAYATALMLLGPSGESVVKNGIIEARFFLK